MQPPRDDAMRPVQTGGSERRRHRRVSLSVPVLAKRMGMEERGVFETGETQDVSLAGVYFTTSAWRDVQPQEVLTVSIAVPREQSRDFPFSRLAGRGRVVRVGPADDATPKEPRLGIALEFAEDLTVLTAPPEHGW